MREREPLPRSFEGQERVLAFEDRLALVKGGTGDVRGVEQGV